MEEIINEEIQIDSNSYHIYGKSDDIYFRAYDIPFSSEEIEEYVSGENISALYDIAYELNDSPNNKEAYYINKLGMCELLSNGRVSYDEIIKLVSDVLTRYENINLLLKSFKYANSVINKNSQGRTEILLQIPKILIRMTCSDYDDEYDPLRATDYKLYEFDVGENIYNAIHEIGKLIFD